MIPYCNCNVSLIFIAVLYLCIFIVHFVMLCNL